MSLRPDRAWVRPAALTGLSSGEVHVWRAALTWPAARLAEAADMLSPDEAERAARYRFPEDRDAFVAGRGLLRTLAARYVGAEPRQLRFSYSPAGQPLLGRHAGWPPLKFSVSHSGGQAVYAFALERAVGVDLEQVRPAADTAALLERFASAAEWAVFRSLAPEQQLPAFFNWWTRKEAYIKAQGQGLSLPLDSFDVAFAPGVPAALLASRPDAREAACWRLEALELGPDYAGAVAVRAPGWALRCWQWGEVPAG